VLPILIYAIPFFVLLLVVEYVSFVLAGEDALAGLVGYEARDTRTSVTMGLGRVVVDLLLKVAIVAGYAGLYELSPLRLHPGDWWFWPLLFVADDFSYYWYHRVHHVCRVFWATHVVHHSSQHYNLSTALRQPWISISTFPFWMWMPLVGFPVWTVLLAQSWNLIYQFWIHTERIARLPRWYEAVFNTPSHHRVHHGAQQQYLDRNYGGELIVWDRLFGTFEPEGERVRYGLTKNINTFNPVRVNFHEYVAIWHDLRLARSWRDRLGVLFRGPGWRPDASLELSEPTGRRRAPGPRPDLRV
jgi:sterol desaturase/sphingolipid hydroxylase (fatty acid hydroxylase superfamily)